MRKIIHVDMDCFYAAIEVRDNPGLRGKPVAVSGSGPRAVVSTASYEARRYGVHSAMPVHKARMLCPPLIVVPHHFDRYKEASIHIRSIFSQYTELIEPLSLDEAYLDVSDHEKYGWTIAKEIRAAIFEETRLTASAGISCNKMLAKIASDWKKPNGQFAILPGEIEAFMKDLPVRRIWGVGPIMAARFNKMGIETCGQLQEMSRIDLARRFGAWGEELYFLCRGMDERPVQPSRTRKSLSTENTFDTDLESLDQCREALDPIIQELLSDLERKASQRQIVELFVKVKFADFQQTTRQCRGDKPDHATFMRLLEEAWDRSPQGVRLLGAGVRFADPDARTRWEQLIINFPIQNGR